MIYGAVRSVVLLVLMLLATVSYAAAPQQPNFVVIVADDLGANDLGTFGHPVIRSPNIDQLARNGMQFDRAFLATSSCSASRASLLTGRYPHSTGAPKLNDVVPENQRLISSYLREAGYYTAAIGKWHNGGLVAPQFDVVKDPPGESGGEGWIDGLRSRPKDKPFFFWLASRDPHVPYSPLPPDSSYQPKDAVMLPVFYDSPEARYTIAQYYTEISRLDNYVGKVVAELRTQNLLDNTYIIFLSDNGAPMPRAKTTLYDAGIKTPLIIAGPKIKAGLKTASLVSAIDVMPTVLDLAGLPKATTMQGESFSRLFQKPDAAFRQKIFAEQWDHGFVLNRRAIRTERYLYISNFSKNANRCILEAQPMGKALLQAFREKKLNREQALCFGHRAPAEELYDVQADPMSFHNLVGDTASESVYQKMKRALKQQATDTQDTVFLQAIN